MCVRWKVGECASGECKWRVHVGEWRTGEVDATWHDRRSIWSNQRASFLNPYSRGAVEVQYVGRNGHVPCAREVK